MAAGLRRLVNWRAFLTVLSSAPSSAQPKLLSDNDPDSVSILISDTPHGRSASSLLARTTIRRITSAPTLGNLPRHLRSSHCAQCGLLSCSLESLERHVARCPNGGARHLLHHGLIKSLRHIVEEARVPKVSIVEDARGLREGDATRPRDFVVWTSRSQAGTLSLKLNGYN